MLEYLFDVQRPRRPVWIPAFAGLSAIVVSSLLGAAPIKTEHAEVELIAEKTALVAGEKNTVGLSIKHARQQIAAPHLRA